MKKRAIAFLLILGMMFESIGSIKSYAEQIQENEVIEEVAPDSKVEFEEDFQEENNSEEMSQDGNSSVEEVNEELENFSEEVTESEDTPVQDNTGGFYGEIDVDEHAISVVDKDGNVSYIDVSGDDTVVGETATYRATMPQIVNLRKTSGVLNYTEVGTGEAGYVAGAYGADAAYLGQSNGKVKFMLAGVIGRIDASKVEVVGLNSVKSVSYYTISSGRLYHYISTNVKIENYGSVLDNGSAPSYLKSGTKYYSYDGHYFYTESNFGNMIDDYNKGTRTHSVNPNNPYYNYFQYLPLRSQSNYNSSTLNTIINNKVAANSKMKNTGSEFVEKQNTYGVNALIMMGIAANESGWGSSNIAQNKNNLFGLDAVDSSPGESAKYFASVEQCIKEFAEKWMSKEYLNPKNWKYFGGFLGNKASGMNVKYASDPYWGEKAASMAWNLDKANGNKDANKYTIGIKDVIGPDNTVNIRKESNTSSTVLFKSPKQGNCAYIVLNQTPVNKFYKIQSDGVLNSEKTAIDTKTGIYSYEKMYAYISADYIKIVSNGTTGGDQEEGWKEEGGKTYYYENGQKVKGTKKIDGSWYYFDTSSGTMHVGWRTSDKQKFYYHEDGKLALKETKIDGSWYYFNSNGTMHVGWRTSGNKKFYYHEDGKLALKETKIDGSWYYFNTNGTMHVGWRTSEKQKFYYQVDGRLALKETKIDGSWYYFNSNGTMHIGWRTSGDKKFYYYADGKLALNETKIDGFWYYFNSNGTMHIGWRKAKGKTYYYYENGQLARGKAQIDGKWYYFEQNGELKKN